MPANTPAQKPSRTCRMKAIRFKTFPPRYEIQTVEHRPKALGEACRLRREVSIAPTHELLDFGLRTERHVEDELAPGVGGVLLHAQADLPGRAGDLLAAADPAETLLGKL